MNDLPTDRPDYAEPLGTAARHSAERRLSRWAEADLDIGPLEILFSTVVWGLLGALVGSIPAVIVRSGGLLAVGLPLGVVLGVVVSFLLRYRVSLRGQRLGNAVALLVGVLAICGACSAIGAITASQNRRAAAEIFRKQRETGIAIPEKVAEHLDAPSVGERAAAFAWETLLPLVEKVSVVQLLILVAVVVFCIELLVLLLRYGRRRGWI